MERITVLMVDDHQVVREGLRTMLQWSEDIEVVGEAADGMEAIQRAAQCQPRVVLMDLRLPKLDGIEATRRIKTQSPATAVIVLTMYDSHASLLEAMRAGADSFLSKESCSDLLIHAIRAVSCGGMMVNNDLLRETLTTMTVASLGQGKELQGLVNTGEHLTARELDVLRLIVQGHRNKEIGQALFISGETAKKHVQNLILKFGVSDRTQVAVKAVRAGLFSSLPNKTVSQDKTADLVLHSTG